MQPNATMVLTRKNNFKHELIKLLTYLTTFIKLYIYTIHTIQQAIDRGPSALVQKEQYVKINIVSQYKI